MKSNKLLEDLSVAIANLPQEEKAGLLKKVNGVFELNLSSSGETSVWSLEFKTVGVVKKGTSDTKPDAVLTLNDEVFVDMVNGKLNGQKAFMGGKLKIKGNMMLATKLDIILKIKPQDGQKKSDVSSTSAPKALSVEVAGFNSSSVFSQIAAVFLSASDAEKEGFVKSGNAIFQFDIKVNRKTINVKNDQGQVSTWTLNLKNNPGVVLGTAGKPDVIISVSDSDFIALSSGKLNGQKAFMAGKLKIKGNMMLATKLDKILMGLKPKSKL